jgi:hypothetical protein
MAEPLPTAFTEAPVVAAAAVFGSAAAACFRAPALGAARKGSEKPEALPKEGLTSAMGLVGTLGPHLRGA